MNKTKRLTLCAILIALAMGLSYIERFIPLNMVVPLPGVKLGLANIVTMMALYFLDVPTAFTVLILRCILNTPFSGSITALAFSLTGGILALSVMAVARHIPQLSVYGVSILGAAAHNVGQIFASAVILGSTYIFAYLPFLLAVSILTGLITGSASSGTFRALRAAGQFPDLRKERHHAGASRRAVS